MSWLLWTLGAALGVAGLGLAAWALFGDRSRRRRRCPKCWYALEGVTGLRCPECGHEAKRERRLFRTRRHWRVAALGVVLLVAGGASIVWQQVRAHGWIGAMPTIAYIVLLPRLESNAAMIELSRRVDDGELREWEYRHLARRCLGIIERREASPEMLSFAASLVGHFERDAPASETDAKRAADAFVGLLDHENASVCMTALMSLGWLGERGAVALPAVMGTLSVDHPQIQTFARTALQRMSGSKHSVHWALTGFDRRDRLQPRYSSFCSALGRCRTDRACAMDVLLDGLGDAHPSVRATAILGIVLIGDPDPALRDRIITLAEDDDDRVRRAVITALPHYAWCDTTADILDRSLAEPSAELHMVALRALAAFGPDAGGFLERVRAIMQGDDVAAMVIGDQSYAKRFPLRHARRVGAAANAYTRIGGDPRTAVDAVSRWINDTEHVEALAHLLDQLAWFELDSPVARGAAEPHLASEDSDVRSAAAFALAMSGGDAGAAADAMIEAITNQANLQGGPGMGFARASSLIARGKIPVSRLVEMLRSDVTYVRSFAAHALGRLGSRAAEALPELRPLTGDPNPDVAAAAGSAVRNIERELAHGH